jgi:pimeloyl-ACP methyl ester carboxylesterase
MINPDKLTIDYRNYEKPEDLPTGYLAEGQGVQMHVVDARNAASDPTFLIPRSFHAYSGQGFEQWRDRVIANELKARVISVDTPGVGLNESAPSVLLRSEEIRQGDLEHSSAITIGAITEALALPEGQGLHILGYSMGAWAAASIAASEAVRKHRIRIASLHLVEPVNDQEWSLTALQKNILREGLYAKRYFKESEMAGFDSNPASLTSGTALSAPRLPSRTSLLYGKGMQYGFGDHLAAGIKEDAHDHATGLGEAPIVIYRANESRVSRLNTLQLTREQLGSYGQSETRLIELSAKDRGHHHLFWQSLGAVGLLTAGMQMRRY